MYGIQLANDKTFYLKNKSQIHIYDNLRMTMSYPIALNRAKSSGLVNALENHISYIASRVLFSWIIMNNKTCIYI